MTTTRLYLADPYLTRFRARVVAERSLDGKPAAVLDQSAFFPEGGGQPGDRGLLGGARVLDTQDVEGEVLHLLEKPLAPGAEVEGEVDWARRLDHMQQHHGQHLLSAAFLRVHGAPTVSFHMGERLCTIDLDCSISKLDEPALRRAERSANESVWRNLPVVARNFVGEERAKLTLRKEAVKGDRVVLVEGVDASPCGGTHPARTADVGTIAVLGAEKWGSGKSRVTFVCGGRVVRELAEAGATLRSAAEAFRCSPAEVGEAAKRVSADLQAKRKALDAMATEAAKLQAAQLHATSPAGPVFAQVERGAGPARALALGLAEHGRVAVVSSVDEGRAYLCLARQKGPGPDLGALLREAVALLGGKGGGSPDLAQGSGEPARLAEAVALVRGKLGG